MKKKISLTNKVASLEIPQDSEIIIKPKRKIHAYDHVNSSANHLNRQPWTKNFNFMWPEDVGLGIEASIDRLEIAKYQEIYYRFLNLGFIDQWGTHCILMSSVLRKILAYHKIKSKMVQVTTYWQNDEKSQRTTIGLPNGYDNKTRLKDNTIDAHIVIKSNNYILDFSMSPIHYQFGLVAPRACIGLSQESEEYQDFGLAGEAAWVESKNMHPIIKHWILEQKPVEQDLVRQYFREYQF